MDKIIIVAYDINPEYGSEAGVAYKLVKVLSKKYKVELFCDEKHKESLMESELNNTKYHFINSKNPAYSISKKLGVYNVAYKIFVKKVEKYLKNNKEILKGAIVIGCLTPAGIHSYNSLYKFEIPVIIGPVGGGISIPKGFERCKSYKDYLKEAYYFFIKLNKKWKKYFINSKFIVIGTDGVKKQLPKECHKKLIKVFDTCVDTDIFYPNYKKKNDKVKILFAGRLDKVKGVNVLLKSVKLLIEDNINNIYVEIIGQGKEYENIKRFIDKNNLNHYVKLVGECNHDDIAEYMRNADIFCLPAIKENGGTAILEAMASGLPVVTSDAAGPSYSVTDECGKKVKLNNYDDFIIGVYEELKYLIKNRDVAENMGMKARARVEQEFSSSKMEDKILSLYEHLSEK